MRSVKITRKLVNAWDQLIVEIPDDAPDTVTVEWLNENLDKCEVLFTANSGCDEEIITEIH